MSIAAPPLPLSSRWQYSELHPENSNKFLLFYISRVSLKQVTARWLQINKKATVRIASSSQPLFATQSVLFELR